MAPFAMRRKPCQRPAPSLYEPITSPLLLICSGPVTAAPGTSKITVVAPKADEVIASINPPNTMPVRILECVIVIQLLQSFLGACGFCQGIQMNVIACGSSNRREIVDTAPKRTSVYRAGR